VRGFEWAAFGSLVAASGLLFLYLRVLGATMRAALLVATAVMLTPSVDRVFANPFLVEPFALALMLLALVAIEGAASTWAIALSLVLLSLTKEIWILLLPLVFIRGLDDGPREAALRTARVAAPPAWIGLFMRWVWSPQKSMESGAPTDLMGVVATITDNIGVFLPEFLLGGFLLIGLIALYREGAREYLGEHALTLLPLLALPLLAATYTGGGAANNFFADDVARLLIYVLPFVAGLAVHLDPDHGRGLLLSSSARVDRGIMALVVAMLAAPLLLDSYSRADLSISRDGPYVLGFTRETLKTARKLDRGETVSLDPEDRKFAWGVSPPNELAKLRFFLRNGFGPVAHYGIHDIRMQEPRAVLVVPILEPRGLRITLTMDARASTWVSVLALKERVGEVLVGPQAVSATFEVPASLLFRGDNPIELHCEKTNGAMPRVLRIELSHPATSP
jgi:hypothetical protein